MYQDWMKKIPVIENITFTANTNELNCSEKQTSK